MHTLARHALLTLGTAALLAGAAGCGGDDNPYKPQPAWSGKKASLPAPPAMPTTPIKNGDGSYTIYGAIHQLRSMLHAKDVTAAPIAITGYIVDSNVGRAPKCAIHKTGKADPADCNTEVPSFWISDNKGDMKGPKIRVVGWASGGPSRREPAAQLPQSGFFVANAAGAGAGSIGSIFCMAMTPPDGSLTMSDTTVLATL